MKISMPDSKSELHLSTTSTIPPILSSLSIDVEDTTEEDEDQARKSNWYKCGKILWKILTSQLGLIILLLCYSFSGAAIFQAIEGPNEQRAIDDMEGWRKTLLSDIYALARQQNTSADFERNASALLQTYEDRLTEMINHGISSGHDNIVWDYWGSLFFCATIFTTIGYGHITPATSWGRIATMIYAIIGIPLFLVIMGKFGKHLTTGLKFIWRYVRKCYYARCCRLLRSRIHHSAPVQCLREKLTCKNPPAADTEGGEAHNGEQRPQSTLSTDSKHSRVMEQVRRVSSQANLQSIGLPINNTTSTSSQDLIQSVEESVSLDEFELEEDFKLPPLLAFAITTTYIFLGALMYTRWEPWTYLEAFYFLFVSVSTIGFGDLIPKHPKYFLASSAYIVLGLALVAMMINVLIEFFNKTIDLAKEKVADVGRHMGLDVDEFENGSNRSRASSIAPGNSPRANDSSREHGRNSLSAEPNKQEVPRRKKIKRRKQPSEVDLATPASVHRQSETKKTKKTPKKTPSTSEEGLANQGYSQDPKGDPKGDPKEDPKGDPKGDPKEDPKGDPCHDEPGPKHESAKED